jgi:hypothetical protein
MAGCAGATERGDDGGVAGMDGDLGMTRREIRVYPAGRLGFFLVGGDDVNPHTHTQYSILT